MSEEVSKYEELTVQICEKLCKEYLKVTPGSEEYAKVASLVEKVTPKMIELVKEKEIEAQKNDLEQQKLDVEREKIEVEKQKLEAEQRRHEFEVEKDKKDDVIKWVAIGTTGLEFLIYIFFLFVSEEWNQAHTMSSPFAQKVLNQLPQFFKRSATPM